MNLYLAEIRYVVTHYECRSKPPVTITRLVKADSVDEAYRKAEKYINDKTDEYSVYYHTESIDISECIE